MKILNKLIEKYANFISRFPYLMVFFVIVLFVIAMYFSGKIEMDNMNNSDMLPDDIPVMWAFNVIGDSFGGDNSIKIAIELDPQYKDSSEPRDIRDPDIIQYVSLLENSALHLDDVTSASSAASLLEDLNDGVLPKSHNNIISLMKDNSMFDQYVSRDYELMIIQIYLTENYDSFEIVNGLRHVIESVPKPAGVIATPAGEAVQDVVVQETMGNDMNKTSMFSMIGILVVLIFLFKSIKYSFTPLATILVGVVWAFGYIGFMGINMTSATSGVASMIMGIGIDFGIQTINRFRQELRDKKKEEALAITMQNVIEPMATTTLAALIGFSAMGMGTLSLMKDMSDMMAYGITACFLAAITIIPALLIIAERIGEKYHKMKKKNNTVKKNYFKNNTSKKTYFKSLKNTMDNDKNIFKKSMSKKKHNLNISKKPRRILK